MVFANLMPLILMCVSGYDTKKAHLLMVRFYKLVCRNYSAIGVTLT